jgi:hypothetical protein
MEKIPLARTWQTCGLRNILEKQPNIQWQYLHTVLIVSIS